MNVNMSRAKYTHEEYINELAKRKPTIEVLGTYTKLKGRLRFRCKVCGHEWETTADQVLNHSGCDICARKIRAQKRRKTTEVFIEQAKQIHGDKYDYSEVNYINERTTVKIRCKKHDYWFMQTPGKHLQGCGCRLCMKEKIGNMFRSNTQKFIAKSKSKFGDKFDYSLVDYKSASTPVKLICPKHGVIEVIPSYHFESLTGCPECSKEVKGSWNRKPLEQFIDEARRVHGNFYDYSLVEYKNQKIPIKIICPIHGEFMQSPDVHLNGSGCHKCQTTRGERLVNNYLIEKGINYTYQYACRYKDHKMIADFYFEKDNAKYIIEYNGEQHYMPVKHFGGEIKFKKQQKRDELMREYCKVKGITLIELKYDLSDEEIINYLNHHLDE